MAHPTNLEDVVRRFDAREFGLTGADIRGRICYPCRGVYLSPGGPVFYRSGPDYGQNAAVAVTVRTRIARVCPDVWPVRPGGDIALACGSTRSPASPSPPGRPATTSRNRATRSGG